MPNYENSVGILFPWGPFVIVPRLMSRIVVVSRWNTETKRSQNGDNKKTMMSGGVWYQPLVISYIYWSVEGHMISYSPHGQDIRLMDSCKYCIRRQKLQHRAADFFLANYCWTNDLFVYLITTSN